MNSIEQFFQQSAVIDTETTNLLPERTEIVEIAASHYIDGAWQTRGTLLGAKNGIPPEASAKNNISNRMIAGLPCFSEALDDIRSLLHWPTPRWYIAHNSKYDQQVLHRAWDQSGCIADAAICMDQSRWICTWRLSRHLLAHEFTDCEYGLNYLRYRLDLPVADNIQLHRASDDTYLCAVLLEYLVNYAVDKGHIDPSQNIGEQLNILCWSPILMKTWPFGKHRGQLLTEISNDYYTWALKNVNSLQEGSKDYDSDLAESICHVLTSRLSNS